MKIFWKVIVAVIAFSLLGIMIVLGTAYIKSVERHTYLADNKVLSDKYVYEEFSNGKKRVKNRATQQVILDRLEWLVTGDKADSLAVFCRKGKRGYLNCYTGEVVIPAQYERAWVFSEGLAAVMSGGKIGFIDRQGRTVIPPTWSYPVGSQEMDYLLCRLRQYPAMWFDRSQWTMESCTSIRLYLYARRRTSDTSKRRSVGGFG